MERLAALMTLPPGQHRQRPAPAQRPASCARGPLVLAVLQAAQAIAAQTHGVFDATVGALPWQFGTAEQHLPSAQDIEAQRRLVGYRGLVIDAKAGTAFLQQRGMALDLGSIAKLPILEAGMRTLRAGRNMPCSTAAAMCWWRGACKVAPGALACATRVRLSACWACSRWRPGHRGVFGRLRALLHGPGRAPAPHPEPGHRASHAGPAA